MSGGSVHKTYVVNSPQGLHMRPLTAFAQKAATFQSDVTVARDGRSVNGKAAWEMMTMISMPGSVLTIRADGPDAPAALDALVALLDHWNEIDAADSTALRSKELNHRGTETQRRQENESTPRTGSRLAAPLGSVAAFIAFCIWFSLCLCASVVRSSETTPHGHQTRHRRLSRCGHRSGPRAGYGRVPYPATVHHARRSGRRDRPFASSDSRMPCATRASSRTPSARSSVRSTGRSSPRTSSSFPIPAW